MIFDPMYFVVISPALLLMFLALSWALPGGEVHLAGSPVIDHALDEGSLRAARTLFPLVFLLSAVLLLFFFPRPYGVAIPFLSVGAGIVWILAPQRIVEKCAMAKPSLDACTSSQRIARSTGSRANMCPAPESSEKKRNAGHPDSPNTVAAYLPVPKLTARSFVP